MPILRLAALAVATLVVVTMAVLPSSAPATPAFYEVEYIVDVDVTANWSLTKKDVADYPKRTFGGDVAARFHGQVENVLFRNGKLLPLQPTGLIDIDSPDGTGFTTVTTWDSIKQTEVTTNGTCGAASGILGASSFVKRAAEQPNPNAERLTWRLTSALPVSFTCSQAFSPGAELANGSAAFPAGAMDTTFELPLEAIGMGKIIQNISASASQRSPEYCPGKDQFTDGCAFNWTGTLTFTKVSEWQYAGDLPSPPVDPRAEAVSWAVEQYGKEPVDPRADAISKAVEQYGKEPAFDPRADAISKAVEQYGKELRFKAVCQTGCAGTAEILPGAGRKPLSAHESAARRKALAKLRFRVPAGKPRQVRLQLPRSARATLRRTRGATVKLVLRPKTGGPKTLTLALKAVRH